MGRGRQGDTWGREIKNRKGIAWEEGARGQGDTWGREIKNRKGIAWEEGARGIPGGER